MAINAIIAILLIFANNSARAENNFSDDDVERIEVAIKSGLRSYFENTKHFAGPKGLLLLKNCDRVQLESQSIGIIPQQSTAAVIEVPVTLFVKAGRKNDSLDVKVKVNVKQAAEGAHEFHFESVKLADEVLSAKDHCAETRANSRLFTSVQAREILVGMPEVAVRASWGEWSKKKTAPDGIVTLEYEGRQVRMRSGLVESWKQ